MNARILSNLPLPKVDGYAVKLFRDYLPDGAKPEAWRSESERRTLAEILPLIPGAEKPDVLLFASPEYLPIPVDIASFPGLKILLITDWNMCLRFLPSLCPLFDFCYTDWPGYRLLKRAGVANVRHQHLFGHDPDRFKVTGKPRDLDVSFCGNLNSGLHGERNRLLARVARWGGAAGIRSEKAGARAIHLRQAFGDGYVDILNRSRLVFNYSIRGEANMRLFESMACGAVPLVEDSNQEASILFQEGKHFFRYAPGNLEEKLESLLADPARIEAASMQAREAVGRYTKSAQIKTLLDNAGREEPRSASAEAGAESAEGAKALIKLRVLGAGYTMGEAIVELQERSPQYPGLEKETLSASLLTLLTRDKDGSLPTAERMLEHHLRAADLPETLRAFFTMKLDVIRERWQDVIAGAGRCLAALEALAADPGSVRSLYGYFHPPLNLGKGMNVDLNHAFGLDLAGGKPSGYLDLLRAHCRLEISKAGQALGGGTESLAFLEQIPLGRFASIEPHSAMIAEYLRLHDAEGVRKTLRLWFTEKPLDTGAWDKIYDAYYAIGDKSALISFLEEVTVLAETFLTPEQGVYMRGLLERELPLRSRS